MISRRLNNIDKMLNNAYRTIKIFTITDSLLSSKETFPIYISLSVCMGDDKKIEIITSISEISEFINSESDDERCLIVLDMDDVLVRGQTLGSDAWFCHSIKDGRNIINVLNDMGYAYSMIDYYQVENNTKDILTDILSRKNVDFMIMTSRGMIHYSQTLKHLRDAGLADLLIRPNILEFEGSDDIQVLGVSSNPSDPIMYPRLRQIRYIDNICFCAGNGKDLVLEEIIHRVHKDSKNKYKKIVFIDDSIQNVNKVYNSFVHPQRKSLYRNIKTYAIHYSVMEIDKRRYNSASLVSDDYNMKYIHNITSHINGKIRTNYVTSLNVLLGVSLLWWFAFRFLGIINC